MTTDKTQRKNTPIARGVLDYFPDAIAEVAHVSYIGNQQHNSGEEMHWAKEKSTDHADCIARHLIERGTTDADGLRHTAKVAWRALALLQIEIEHQGENVAIFERPARRAADGLDLAEQSRKAAVYSAHPKTLAALIALGCPDRVARQIVGGITYSHPRYNLATRPWVYISGPMRGCPDLNFPAFDACSNRLTEKGWNVISPADIDRGTEIDPLDDNIQATYALRDFWSLYYLRKLGKHNAIALLPGWQKSQGAAGEFFTSRWLGLTILDDYGVEVPADEMTRRFVFAND